MRATPRPRERVGNGAADRALANSRSAEPAGNKERELTSSCEAVGALRVTVYFRGPRA